MTLHRFLIGVNTLIVYNMFINVMLTFETVVWPGQIFNDLCGGFNQLGAMLVTFYLIWRPKLSTNTRLTLYCGVTAVIVGALVPLVPQFLYGTERFTLAVTLLSLASFILGLTAGAFQCQGFAYAVITEKSTITYVSLGNGFAGVYSFFFYTIFFEGVFDKSDLNQQLQLIWALFAVGIFASLVQVVFAFYMFRQDFFQEALSSYLDATSHDVESSERSLKSILKDSWHFAFASGFIFFVTICVYPMVGPFSWPMTSSWMNALNGVFQIGDMLFRFIPELGPRFLLSRKVTMVGTLARTIIFIPLFMIPARLPEVAVLSNEWFLLLVMVVFVLSNGWFATCAQIHTMQSVTDHKETNVVANILTVGIVSQVTVALFFSKVFIL